ncbi:hypothetical protein BV22DRAFT_1129078 [Leucogyrophana mollusca]|uniref:Uncharacterized protein n=1 Tax=Leucogyrophana mollusca TaxID=85980 RepID=A0ACB8BKG6_9AGAM|nr:hypothetical protein BV22DRAFT_1129078 [Leucogyrophana mollusca]
MSSNPPQSFVLPSATTTLGNVVILDVGKFTTEHKAYAVKFTPLQPGPLNLVVRVKDPAALSPLPDDGDETRIVDKPLVNLPKENHASAYINPLVFAPRVKATPAILFPFRHRREDTHNSSRPIHSYKVVPKSLYDASYKYHPRTEEADEEKEVSMRARKRTKTQ